MTTKKTFLIFLALAFVFNALPQKVLADIVPAPIDVIASIDRDVFPQSRLSWGMDDASGITYFDISYCNLSTSATNCAYGTSEWTVIRRASNYGYQYMFNTDGWPVTLTTPGLYKFGVNAINNGISSATTTSTLYYGNGPVLRAL